MAILGTGNEKYMKLLSDFKEQGARNISITLEFKAQLAHQIYAGSDMFLMPSHYEPCGLGQLIALRYGTVPIVRKTGGLADTVFDVRDNPKDPNGFTFTDYTPEAFHEAISRALQVYMKERNGKNLATA
jgi:starch synthase